MRIVTYILLLTVVLVGVTFASLNAESVVINYYIGKNSLPLSLLLALTLVLGCLIGFFIGFYFYLKQKSTNYRLKHRIKLVEKEVENLRAIPLKNEP